MTYAQLDYYYKNREKILEKNRIKAEGLAKYNQQFGVSNKSNKGGRKKYIKKQKDNLTIKKGLFKISFD